MPKAAANEDTNIEKFPLSRGVNSLKVGFTFVSNSCKCILVARSTGTDEFFELLLWPW